MRRKTLTTEWRIHAPCTAFGIVTGIVIMAPGAELDPAMTILIAAFLFPAVGVACCMSNIAFPWLFTKEWLYGAE